jgi:ribosomal protein L7/L12
MAAEGGMGGDLAAWGALVGSGASIVAIITAIMKLGGRLTAAEDRSTAAEKLSHENDKKVDQLVRDFGDYKIEAAKEQSTVRALAEQAAKAIVDSEHRMTVAIQEIGQALRHMTERFDAFIGGQQSSSRKRR